VQAGSAAARRAGRHLLGLLLLAHAARRAQVGATAAAALLVLPHGCCGAERGGQEAEYW